jgi:hypothetical protein
VPEWKWKLHYSLSPQKRELEPLATQAKDFITFITETDQFDRAGGAVAQSTVRNIMESLYLFLGFLEHHLGISTPSILNFMDPEQYIQFISFSVAKGRTITSIQNLVGHTRKILSWLSTTNPHLGPRIVDICFWLDNVKRQLTKSIPKKKRDMWGSWKPRGNGFQPRIWWS